MINNNLNAVIFAKHPKKLNLSSISDNIYQIVYKYLRNKWRPLVHLKTSTSIIGDGENFMGNASSYSHLWLQRLRYGAVTAHQVASACLPRLDQEMNHLLQILPLCDALSQMIEHPFHFPMGDLGNRSWCCIMACRSTW
ncbi:hypothetical protein BDR07DRAFT_782708 [Suillus spraguei]|nr:hypothetical protein BDR07DRAFT_814984 [Suillus spraguei]KAG2352969.1 hypothetical protein BDR07DRAFT_782708 [Suillus spraguei]